MKLSKIKTSVDRERDEVRALLQTKYTPDLHHILIDSIQRHGNAKVVLFVVEAPNLNDRRVAIIRGGRITNDILAS